MAEYVSISALLLGLTLLTAKMGEDLAKRSGIPSFIGAVVAGILLGPAALDIVNPEELVYIKLFILLGIDFLLFIAGAEELAEALSKKPSLKTVGFSILLMVLPLIVTSVFVHMITENMPLAIAIGIIMGIVSVGPMVKTLMEIGELKTSTGAKLVTLGLLAETIGIIAFNAVGESVWEMARAVFMTTVFLIILYYIGKRLFPAILHVVERASWAGEASFAVIIALILTTGYLAEILGFNAAVVSLILGVFAASYLRERPDHMEKLKAFTYGFFEPLFFAGIGLYMSKINLLSLMVAGVLVALLMFSKILVVKLYDRGMNLKYAFLILSKGGIDAALLASILESKKLGEMPPEIYTASVVTIIVLAIISALPFRGASRVETGKNASFWGQPVKNLSYLPIYVDIGDTIKKASSLLSEYPSIIIVKEGEPIGYLTQSDLLYIDPELASKLRIAVLEPFKPVPIVSENESLYRAMIKLYETESNVIAVVDKNGKIKGALYARQILEALSKQKLVSE